MIFAVAFSVHVQFHTVYIASHCLSILWQMNHVKSMAFFLFFGRVDKEREDS